MISAQFIFWIKYQSFRRYRSSCTIVSNFTVYLYTVLCIRMLLSEEKSIVDCLSESHTGWLPGIQQVMLPPSDFLFFFFFLQPNGAIVWEYLLLGSGLRRRLIHYYWSCLQAVLPAKCDGTFLQRRKANHYGMCANLFSCLCSLGVVGQMVNCYFYSPPATCVN